MLQHPWKAAGLAPEVHIYVDFDGTIAPAEPTDQLFDRFAHPSWRENDAAWLDGRISSWEAMTRNVALLRASPEEMSTFLRSIPIDPAFPAFLGVCQNMDAHVTVISDGLDLVLRTVLGAAGITLPFASNMLLWKGGRRWEVRFPHKLNGCRFNMGNCKCSHQARRTSGLSVMVGDGRSDFCIAERCDLVIAKGSLLARCKEKGLPHIAMESFADANLEFSRWLYQARAGTHEPAAILQSPVLETPFERL